MSSVGERNIKEATVAGAEYVSVSAVGVRRMRWGQTPQTLEDSCDGKNDSGLRIG